MIIKKVIPVLSVAGLLMGCSSKSYYKLNERNFFMVMTNIQYYPEEYVNKTLEFDCFTYEITDIDSKTYMAGVRKCSSGYGCTCGQDTIIGFLLNYESDLPKPKNQSEDTNEKTWIHLIGHIESSNLTTITIHSYNEDGSINEEKNEQLLFLSYTVENYELINDYQNLNYYVTK